MNFKDRSGFILVQAVKELPIASAVSTCESPRIADEEARDVNVGSSVIHPDDLGKIRRQAKAFGFHEAYVLPASDIIIAKWVEMKCRYGCANYNTSWCCPPAAPGLEETRLLIKEYELALLLVQARKGDGSHSRPGVNRRHQIRMWKATVALERNLFLMGYYKAFGMPSEACALCKECAYPRPCKFPKEKRPSIEACSIDVFQIAKNLGRSPRVAGNTADEYESYSLILIA